MKATLNSGSRLRFGQFELNLSEEKLLKKGLPVRLENQPLQILAALLDRPGELVSREELCANSIGSPVQKDCGSSSPKY
jgi:DNA-binding winged helix-turn-helix (wHTH) protein